MATKTTKATKNNKSKSTKKENPMTANENILNIFNTFIEAGGMPKVTEFKKHLDQLINAEIKPLCSSRGKSAGGTGWRSEQKAKFSGRGAKWVKLSTDEIAGTLDRFDNEGIETADYRKWIEAAGFAWIRYNGPRVDGGNKMAAFEVRTVGSTYDCPKQLHYILDEEVDGTVTSLGGTPFAMKLEASTPVATTKTIDEKVQAKIDELDPALNGLEEEEVEEVEKELNAAPTSDDPEEWEAFLAAEGLGIDDEEEDDLYNF